MCNDSNASGLDWLELAFGLAWLDPVNWIWVVSRRPFSLGLDLGFWVRRCIASVSLLIGRNLSYCFVFRFVRTEN